MIYHNKDGLIIRSMVEYDIEKLVKGFLEQGWRILDLLQIKTYRKLLILMYLLNIKNEVLAIGLWMLQRNLQKRKVIMFLLR